MTNITGATAPRQCAKAVASDRYGAAPAWIQSRTWLMVG
jgi:hypothetical protein